MTTTVKKALVVGFDYAGQRVYDFTVRPAIVADSIEAIEELGSDCSKARLRVGVESRQVTFEGVPKEDNMSLVMSLCDKDYGVLTEAIDEVEKKHLAPSKP